jgi:hypothetical protein
MAECWICGAPADSGEHKAKRSDIRSILGTPTQHRPFHLRSQKDGKQKLIGLNTQAVIWSDKICSPCNNAVSAPYDRAWEKLSTFLQKHPKGLPSINLQTVYGPKYQAELHNLYLYFVKLFGCYIVNSGVQIDTEDFSKGLLKKRDLSDFYIRCSYFPNWPVEKMIALTEMAVANDGYGPCIAIAGYAIGPWCIDMTYWAPRAEAPPIIASSFKPSRKQKALAVNRVKD